MLPAGVRFAGTGGAPVESAAIRNVVSTLMAPAGKLMEAPEVSVIVPPAAPTTGGGGGCGVRLVLVGKAVGEHRQGRGGVGCVGAA